MAVSSSFGDGVGVRLRSGGGVLLASLALLQVVSGCMFYPAGEYLRFVRIPENVAVGGEVLQVEVHPRRNLSLQAVDKSDDARYFSVRPLNGSTVAVILARSLEDLVDSDTPQNVLKFRLLCQFDDGNDAQVSFLSVTVYVEDVNDHAPRFIDAPYRVTVDELTPAGLTIFRGIHAVDRDKPNTPNSDVQYSLVGGNEAGKFALESAHRAALVVRSPLDYDAGDHEFNLRVMASDRGSPPLNSTTDIRVIVLDSDDLNPRFTREVYRTQIAEFYPMTGARIHHELRFTPAIAAYDQDRAIDAPLRYDIVGGNERRLFRLDTRNGSLFLERELDLDTETALPGNTFVLTVQASQMENPLRAALARVEVELQDLNDNVPEFEVDLYNISIVENLPSGFSVLQVVASDRDQGDNAFFTYQLDDPSRAFNIDARTGWLTVRDQAMLDRERQSVLNMRVLAKEKVPSVVRGASNSSSVNVTVTLLDANDNNPTFVPSNLYEFSVRSDANVGDIIGKVEADDPDVGRNGMVLYDVQRTSNLSSGPPPFAVNPQTGVVSVAESPLTPGRHAIFIEASDQPANPSERRFSLAVVSVDVLLGGKSSDSLPDFEGAPYEFWVGSNVPVGTSVGQIRVTEDVRPRKVSYDLLHSYHEGVPFAVEERSGTITVVSEMSQYDRTLYDFEAVANVTKDNVLVTNVTIHVVQPEDEATSLFKTGQKTKPLEFRVRENIAGAVVGQLLTGQNVSNVLGLTSTVSSPLANIGAMNMTRPVRFIIANQHDVADKFAISQDGTLYTQRGLDREERDSYHLTILTENSKGVVLGSGIFQVTVTVEDENDNAPVFDRTSYEGRITEDAPGGTEVALNGEIRATDADSPPNAHISFALYGEGREHFALDPQTGKISLRRGANLDREEKATYVFRIIARDKGGLSSEVLLTIYVDDVNDNSPQFVKMTVVQDEDMEVGSYNPLENDILIVREKRTGLKGVENILNSRNSSAPRSKRGQHLPPMISIPENMSAGTPIIRLLAEDKDTGLNSLITYNIAAETRIPSTLNDLSPGLVTTHFRINPNNGELSVARPLPPETEFHLNVTGTDGGGRADSVNVKVYIKDVNDHAPVFVKSRYTFSLPEGIYSNHVIGKLEATDADFGENANVSYSIKALEGEGGELPFFVSDVKGELSVDGYVDRETRDTFLFKVIAEDHGRGKNRKRSLVDVEVQITDINDNAPAFYNYDKIVQVETDNGQGSTFVPVYYVSVPENAPLGTPVSRVFANDSDFSGNGNGHVFYLIPPRPDRETLFAIDSKEGTVTTNGKLDYETQSTHNVTIIAADLGNPSLNSTAMLIVKVIDVPEALEDRYGPVFTHRYYEVEVEENCQVPVVLLTLNVTEPYRGHSLKFSLVPPKSSTRGVTSISTSMFRVDPRNGTVFLIQSPDREDKDRHEVIVRVEPAKRGRALGAGAHMIYPVPEERLKDLAPSEVKIVMRVTDVNDNPPRFPGKGRPVVAAIPSSAPYGYQIVRLQAKDPDHGVNAEVRYQMLGRVDDESNKFTIDPITGQVRSIGSFSRDGGRVFGFDVKATDRRGADDGKSAIANVFVYVLDEEKQLVMVMEYKPIDAERNMENITTVLSNVTGLDVRVRKLQPRLDDGHFNKFSTDVYLYAVDPVMNVIIDMEALSEKLVSHQMAIQRRLPDMRSLDLVSGIRNDLDIARMETHTLSALEVGVVVLGCVVFMGALAAALCVGCVRRFKHKKHVKDNSRSMFKHSHLGLGMKGMSTVSGMAAMSPPTISAPVHHKSHMYPSASPTFFGRDGLASLSPGTGVTLPAGSSGGGGGGGGGNGGGGDTTDTYVEMHSNKSSNCTKRRYPTNQRTRRSTHHRHQHEPTCSRHKRQHARRRGSSAQSMGVHLVRTNSGAFGTSTADSGVHDVGATVSRHIFFGQREHDQRDVERDRDHEQCCPCGHSPSHSSAESSNGSYEDSLKSSRHGCGHTRVVVPGMATAVHPESSTATISRSGRHQRQPSLHLIPTPPQVGPHALLRRPSDRNRICSLQT